MPFETTLIAHAAADPGDAAQPAAAPNAANPVTAGRQRRSAATGRSILLVDDDEAFCQATQLALAGAGFSVTLAPDAHRALGHFDDGAIFALGIFDIVLPAGTPHGFACARMLALRQPEMRIMYVTGLVKAALGTEADRALGKIWYKPLKLHELVAEVQSLLGS